MLPPAWKCAHLWPGISSVDGYDTQSLQVWRFHTQMMTNIVGPLLCQSWVKGSWCLQDVGRYVSSVGPSCHVNIFAMLFLAFTLYSWFDFVSTWVFLFVAASVPRLQPSWKVCGSTGCVSSQALMLVDWHFRAKRHSLKTRTCFFLGWWFSSQTGYQLLKHVTRRVSYVGIGSMRSPAIAD